MGVLTGLGTSDVLLWGLVLSFEGPSDEKERDAEFPGVSQWYLPVLFQILPSFKSSSHLSLPTRGNRRWTVWTKMVSETGFHSVFTPHLFFFSFSSFSFCFSCQRMLMKMPRNLRFNSLMLFLS